MGCVTPRTPASVEGKRITLNSNESATQKKSAESELVVLITEVLNVTQTQHKSLTVQ